MLRKALSLSDMPYKSGCICSETEGRRAPFCPSCPRLGGNAPKTEAADVLARAIFIRFLAFLGGDAPNFVTITSECIHPILKYVIENKFSFGIYVSESISFPYLL